MKDKSLFIVFIVVLNIAHWSNGQRRPKEPSQESDVWVWGGHHDLTTTSERPSSKFTVPQGFDNPCAPYNPPVPDFSAPGRRISEAKCYEYIWQMKQRYDKVQRKERCKMLKRSTGMRTQILGGRFTFAGEFPNMGAIGWKSSLGTWKFMCGGSLISSKWFLTAAHCTKAVRDTTIEDITPKIIRLGVMNIQVDNNYIKDADIIKIVVHPSYRPPKQYFDIALMELVEVVDFSLHVQPACLWNKDNITVSSGQAEVAGWGVVNMTTKETSPELLAASVDVIDSEHCNDLLMSACNRNWCRLKDQLCAGKLSGGVDACQGDSGGPLQVKITLPITTEGAMRYVIGVTSFGVGCGNAGLPGVYTKVSSFIDWIENIVWPGL